ncbi:MAG: NAD-dependent epimerase/dehydratase family protein, partial [Candidatus Bathyarchaeia archaeon]
MKALVTGATGFLGSFLMAQLLDTGATVFGTFYDSEESPVNENPQANLQWCDIRDVVRVRRLVRKSKPDV